MTSVGRLVGRLVFLPVLMLAGCSEQSKPAPEMQYGEKFIGTWSNEWTGGGLQLIISRDGNNFIVKELHTANGGTVSVNSAHLQDGYMVSNDNKWLKRLTYLEAEDSIQPLDTPIARPAFRRVGDKK